MSDSTPPENIPEDETEVIELINKETPSSYDNPLQLIQHLKGEINADDLTAEDWLLPIQVTDGELCLYIQGINGGEYWRADGDGTVKYRSSKSGFVGRIEDPKRMLEKVIEAPHNTIKPILYDNTPFIPTRRDRARDPSFVDN